MHCDAIFGGGVWEVAMVLALLSVSFQSLPPLPTIKLGPSGADSQVGGFVYVLGPCGSLQRTLLWSWEFLLLPSQPSQVFSLSGLKLYFPVLEPWAAQSVAGSASCCLAHPAPQSTSLLGLPAAILPTLVLQPPPCRESSPLSCPSPPLLPVWMNVSSSPWLSDFHTVRLSVGSGCFLFLNCCCPSIGCARRHSVSTYASILAGSPDFLFLYWWFLFFSQVFGAQGQVIVFKEGT